MRILILLIMVGIIITSLLGKQVVNVGFEPLPPLIIDASKGYTIEILKAIERNSDLEFNIVIMPYIRARNDIFSGSSQLMGHTPYCLETKEFYEKAQEINFSIEVKADLYVMDEKLFKDYKALKIGIPRGNESFASDLLGIPAKNFYLGDLENLLKMLEARRIDAIWFERSSTMSTIDKLKIKNVYYMNIPSEPIPAGLAVQKTSSGNELKIKLETALKKVDTKSILKDLVRFNQLPTKGIVK